MPQPSAISPDTKPCPDFQDIPYGTHPRQKLDIYLPSAAAQAPFPTAIFIHGGGWRQGDKAAKVKPEVLERFLQADCALVAINYRYTSTAIEEGVFPPVLAPLHDARRAVQFIRHHAAQWNLNGERIVLFGGSAGAFSALWVAYSPDPALVNPGNALESVSTRVLAVGGSNAQTTIDPQVMRDWVGPELTYGAHAFGLSSFQDFLDRRGAFAPWYPKLSPASLVQRSSPPTYLEYTRGLHVTEADPDYYPHSPQFGIHFTQLARDCGAACHLSYPGQQAPQNDGDMVDFLITALNTRFRSSRK